ncbi:MAG: hypothetical protein JNM39_16965 [Bdellovibrionaceae bacterium]|nr:hypothetical protein [Pseudobdellovibrionaceae bacterium]
MKMLMSLSLLLILYFIYGFYISQYDPTIIKQKLKVETSSGFYDYRGVVNVHTDRSIGSSSPQAVAAAARQAGLDFIIISDLNVFDRKVVTSNQENDAVDGYTGSTLVISGGKYSYLDSRLIYCSTTLQEIGRSLGEAQTTLSDLLSQRLPANKDNLLILAHPFKAGFSWSGEIPSGLDGMEIFNLKSQAQRAWEESKLSVLWTLLTYPFNPKLSFLRLFFEPTEELALFDQVSQKRKFVAFGGAEASARAIPAKNFLIRFPSYVRSFEVLSNHLLLRSELTGNSNNDKLKIIQALKAGQFYVSVDLLGDPRGFNAYVEDGSNKIWPLGSALKFKPNQKLMVSLPLEPKDFYEVVVYRNGLRYATFNTKTLQMPISEPGTYRVQVRVSPYLPLPDAKRWITWIYTNPFQIFASEGAKLEAN